MLAISRALLANPRIGPVALSDMAPSVPKAFFDWITHDKGTGRKLVEFGEKGVCMRCPTSRSA